MRPLRVLFRFTRRYRARFCSSPASEKLLHQRSAFILQNARADLNPMIQKISVADAKPTRHCACSFIRRAINQTSDSSLYQSPCAHRARLDRRVNINAREPVVAEFTGSFAKRDDFGVGGRIAVGTRAIPRDSNKLVLTDDAGANGNLATRLRLTSGGQSLPHPILVKISLKQRTATIGQIIVDCQLPIANCQFVSFQVT